MSYSDQSWIDDRINFLEDITKQYNSELLELKKKKRETAYERLLVFLNGIQNGECIFFNKKLTGGTVYTYAVVKTPNGWYSTAEMVYRRNPTTAEIAKFILDTGMGKEIPKKVSVFSDNGYQHRVYAF